ncbi:YhaN family protein [Chthonobacter albigriseus]|uniref:YhaN family protein n=1 Tax=Chthonobacter albigriseus TaxID=1683161 RepID=UPI0015EF3309|nr:YhaN family protein [Chthonobacter albigriseus]
MRILRLHLDRYGAFTDRHLEFDPAAPLTVVHGPNEAGKSTALAALADALFGIEARSRYDFLHDYGSMRIGAVLRAADGRELAFRRRKGLKATLLDETDQPIADDSLAPYLGRVDRALFTEAFALDQDRLRAGGRALKAGEGSLGEALLAAAPGLGRLVELRRSTADAASALFDPGRRGKAINAAAQRWDEARRRVRDLSLTAAAVEKARAARDDAAAEVARLDAERRNARVEKERLSRLEAALPAILRLDSLGEALAALADAPRLPAGFAEAIAAFDRAIAAEETALALLARQRDDRLAGLAALQPRADILAEADAIDRLAADRRTREAADRERADAEAAIRQAEAALADRAAELGIDPADLLARRPTAAELAALKGLARTGRDHAARRTALQDGRDAAADRLARTGESPAVGLLDPAPLKATLDALSALETALRTLAQRDGAAVQARVRLDGALAQVGLAGPDDLRRRRLPIRDAIDRAETDDRDAWQRLDLAVRRLAETTARREDAEAALAGTADAQAPVSDDALSEARERRSGAWARTRAILFGEVDASPSTRLDTARDLERSTDEADAIADRRLQAADRLALLARRRAEADAAEVAHASAAGEHAAALRESEEATARWTAVLADHGLPPMSPNETRTALERHAEALARLDQWESAATDAGVAKADADRLAATLAALCAEVGVRADPADPIGTLARARAAVQEADAAFQAEKDRRRAQADAEWALREADAALAALATAADGWRADWRIAVAAVGLGADAAIEAAEAALGIWAEVPEIARSREAARARRDAIAARAAEFDREAARLGALIAPLPEDIRTADVAHRLAERLTEARALRDRRAAEDANLAAVEEEIGRREALLHAARADRLRACAAAGLPPDADLVHAVAQSAEAADLSRRMDDTRAGLIAAARRPEADLRAELAGVDPDALAADADAVEERLETLDRDHAAAVAVFATARDAYERLIAEEGAETAGQEAENAMSAVLRIAEDWRLLQAANRLAGAVVEEFRRRHQSPVLGHATSLFATLTEGRYPALAADYDDEGRARLVVVREDGRRLDPDALSEGTQDQLYLALRLATLADHATRAEPLPFVGDDLFVTFDEARTRAGLTALADFGETTQAILFTHHEHVAAIAGEALGARASVIRL